MILKKMPLVTIVTLTYKKFNDLKKCIHSVLIQNYPNIEYIISDDGSENFPYEEIKKYIEENKRENDFSYKIKIKNKNEGTVKNINDAYKDAQGVYLMPLSADDCFRDENVVSRVVDRFIKTGAELLCTSRIAIDKDGNEIKKIPSKFEEDRINKLTTSKKQYKAFILDKFYNIASGSTMYMKKDTFLKMEGFDTAFMLWEDGPFVTKYTKNGGVITKAYDIISINYGTDGVSAVGKVNPLMRKDRLYYNKKYRQYDRYFSRFEKRKCRYICERYKNNNINKWIIYFKYLDIVIYKCFENIKDYLEIKKYK